MRYFIFILTAFFWTGCGNAPDKQHVKNGSTFEKIHSSRLFGILKSEGYRQVFYLHEQDTQWGPKIKDGSESPRIAVLSTVFAGFIELLGEQEQIVAIDNEKFYSDTSILERVRNGSVLVVGEEGQLQIEKLLVLKPDYLVCSTFEFEKNSTGERLEKLGVKILYCDNFKEQHPLARAEWIRFFGVITGRSEKADSLFNVVMKNYNEIADRKNKGKDIKAPKVLVDAMYGESWFVPGGNSFTAQLIRDAGGEYVFSDKQPLFSYPLSLEEVYKQGKDADIWIHTNRNHTLHDLENADRRYTLFKPFTNKRIYNNDNRENAFGGNDFWETGVGRPDLILSDLYAIFHDNRAMNDSMNFYRKLE